MLDKHRYVLTCPALTDTRFTNGVLTDVTESLFSAFKHWNCGSATLFETLVHLCGGCREMMLKPYLENIGGTKLFREIKTNPCAEVKELFTALLTRLTWRAVEAMYKDYKANQLRFSVGGAQGQWAARQRLFAWRAVTANKYTHENGVPLDRSEDAGGWMVTHKKMRDQHFVGSGALLRSPYHKHITTRGHDYFNRF